MQFWKNLSRVDKQLIGAMLFSVVMVIGVFGIPTGDFANLLLAIGGFGGLLASLVRFAVYSSENSLASPDAQREPSTNAPDQSIDEPVHNHPTVSSYIPDIPDPLWRERTIYDPPQPVSPQEPEVRGHAIYQHALDAIIAANKRVDTSQPIPIDIGFIVYRGTDKPAIYRTRDIPDNADAIQPYVQLHVPLPLLDLAMAQIRFEIINTSDNLLFSNVQSYELKDDLNLITPPARLLVDKLDTTDFWELRVNIGETLLARHVFTWGIASTEDESAVLEADGEISDEMRNLIEDQAEQPLSLDDLLAGDDDQQLQQES